MVTPAFLIIPLVYFVGRQLENPRIKSILQTVVIAGLPAAVIPRSAMALVASTGSAAAVIISFVAVSPNTGRHCRCGLSPLGRIRTRS
jgi:chromate transporter